MGLTESQKRANKKYNEKNQEKRRYLSFKSTSKTFINNYGTNDDLHMLLSLIHHKLNINSGDTCAIDKDSTCAIDKDSTCAIDKDSTCAIDKDSTCAIDKNDNTFDSNNVDSIKKGVFYDKLDDFIKSNNIDLTDKKAKSKAINDFHATFDKRSKRAVQNDVKNYIDINQIGK